MSSAGESVAGQWRVDSHVHGPHTLSPPFQFAIREQEVPASVAQRVLIPFLAYEGVKSSEILKRLHAPFGDTTLSKTQVFDWAKKFRNGEKSKPASTVSRKSFGYCVLGFKRCTAD